MLVLVNPLSTSSFDLSRLTSSGRSHGVSNVGRKQSKQDNIFSSVLVAVPTGLWEKLEVLQEYSAMWLLLFAYHNIS